MKKSLVTFASALVLASAFVSNASARDGFYFGLRGGATNYNFNNKEDSATNKSKLDFGNVWNISGAVGYRYGFVRLEAEYIYRDDVDDKFEDAMGTPLNATMESDSFMANAYLDFMPNYWISPYIHGGIGLTRLDLSYNDIGSGGVADAAKIKHSADNFTWTVGGGISLRLNKCVNLVTVIWIWVILMMLTLMPMKFTVVCVILSNKATDKKKTAETLSFFMFI